MPTLIENTQQNGSNKYKKEPKFLTKFDTNFYEKEENSILDSSFRSDSSDLTDDDELGLATPYIDEKNVKEDKFKTQNYEKFQVKTLPTKEKIIIRNNYTYLDPKAFSIVWYNVFLFVVLHSLGFLGFYKCFTEHKYKSFIASILFGIWGGLGITAGAHRLWSHKSYKARLPLRIFLMIGHTVAGQNNLFVWCRDHRVHHKFSETDADPHNSLRGFFFAHMGWLLRKKHPDVMVKGNNVPFKDLLEDPVVRFNVKYYYLLYFVFSFFIPVWTGAYVLGEGWFLSFLVCVALRYCTSLHSTWFVNSAAHMFGDQPYNVKQKGRENPFVAFGSLGEGFHNYHHSFPFDYSTSELGSKLNMTKKFIDLMAIFGLAYDLKRCSREVVENSMAKALLENERKRQCAY